MIKHTIDLFLFSELTDNAQKIAVQKAIDCDWFGYYAQSECDNFTEGLRYYLEKIATVSGIEYSVGFSKSDFFRIKFNRIQWQKGAKESLDYAPPFIVDFFNDIQSEFKKLVYLFKYTPNEFYGPFTHVKYGTGHSFPDAEAAIKDAIKRLEKSCYHSLRDIVLDYSSEDSVRAILSEDDNRLYTKDGSFYCTAFELTHGDI